MSVEIEAPIIEDIKENVRELTKQEERDAFEMLTTVDPKTGIDYAWLDIRERLQNGDKPIEVLPDIFDFYQEKNPYMDAWANYLLACSHFEPADLDGPQNRAARRRLELKVKKLIKARKHDAHSNIRQFIHNNRDII